jgi:hypothetical protein
MATAHLALGNGMQLERLTRPEEFDIDTIQQAASLLAWGRDSSGERERE